MLQKSPDLELKKVDQTERDDALLCQQCQRLITRERWQTSVGGHQHRLTNPLGITFNVCCFEMAPGVATSGPATNDHSWFSGYGWKIARCRECHTHLGWRYSGGNIPSEFFGLICEKLSRRPSTSHTG